MAQGSAAAARWQAFASRAEAPGFAEAHPALTRHFQKKPKRAGLPPSVARATTSAERAEAWANAGFRLIPKEEPWWEHDDWERAPSEPRAKHPDRPLAAHERLTAAHRRERERHHRGKAKSHTRAAHVIRRLYEASARGVRDVLSGEPFVPARAKKLLRDFAKVGANPGPADWADLLRRCETSRKRQAALALGQRHRFDTIRGCGSKTLTQTCTGCGKAHVHMPLGCAIRRVCETCAIRMGDASTVDFGRARAFWRTLAEEAVPFEGYARWSEKFLTLTIPHRDRSEWAPPPAHLLSSAFRRRLNEGAATSTVRLRIAIQQEAAAQFFKWLKAEHATGCSHCGVAMGPRPRFHCTGCKRRMRKPREGEESRPCRECRDACACKRDEQPCDTCAACVAEPDACGHCGEGFAVPMAFKPQFARWTEWEPASDGKGHPHAHVYALSPFLDVEDLRRQYAQILRELGWRVDTYDADGNPVVQLDVEAIKDFDARMARELTKGGARLSATLREARAMATFRPEGAAKSVVAYGNHWALGHVTSRVSPRTWADVYIEFEGRRLAQATRGFLGAKEWQIVPRSAAETQSLVAAASWANDDGASTLAAEMGAALAVPPRDILPRPTGFACTGCGGGTAFCAITRTPDLPDEALPAQRPLAVANAADAFAEVIELHPRKPTPQRARRAPRAEPMHDTNGLQQSLARHALRALLREQEERRS